MRFGLLTLLFSILLLPSSASAQLLGGALDAGNNAFSVSVSPQYPTPYGQAVISLLSSSLDLTNATLTVTASGKSVYQGNVRPVAIQLGKAGSNTSVGVTVSLGGAEYKQTLSIRPQDLALIAEPLSSVPPLYPGKSLTPLEGSVRVVAVANLKDASGRAISPSTYSYVWTVDDTQIARASGIGKTAIIVATPLEYRLRTVSVVVNSADWGTVGGASLSLVAQQPLVRVYENDPLLGIRYERALSGQYSITRAESTLYAAPFSFSTTNSTPLVRWFLNGAPAQTGNLITLRPTGSGEGSASLSVVASVGDYANATTNLSLIFGDTPSTNFFGL